MMWLFLWATLALAGNKQVPLPGVETWSAPLSGFEAPGSCESCSGPRAFAVVKGTGWVLLSKSLVSTRGQRIELPYAGLDMAAGWSSDGPTLWILTHETRFRLVRGALVDEGRQGIGRPLRIGGDGTVETSETLAGQPPRSPYQVPWIGGAVELQVGDGRAEARWNGRSLPIPGSDIMDARAIGEVDGGSLIVAVTDSRDRSAASGVRFIRLGPRGAEPHGQGTWNGDAVLRLTRYYAADPSDGAVYALMTVGDKLSLRRYDTSALPGGE